METPYRKDYSQDTGHIRKNILPIQTCLSINIQLSLYKALIRSITVYALPPGSTQRMLTS
jgi:hypothetical protein